MKSEKEEIIKKDKEYIIHGWAYSPLILTEGRGCIVKDIDGKEYIDCIAGAAGPAWVGHSNPKVIEAIKNNLFTLGIYGLGNVTIQRVRLAEKLINILPKGMNKIFIGSGGTDAISTALKAAHIITGRKEAIGLYFGYHGFTLDLIGLGGACVATPELKKGLPIMPGYRQIPPPYCYRCFYGKSYPDCDFECARALEYAIIYGSYRDVAAFIIEPILGNSGMIMPPSKEYAKIIKEICEKYGVLIIADEVQTGLGRTGKMWGSEYIGLEPDIICLGKGLGGGLPVSATIFKEDKLPIELMREKWWQAFSSSGAPILCAAAEAVIDFVVQEKIPQKAEKMGNLFMQGLKKMNYEIIGDIRGAGLFIGIELVKDRKTKEPAIKEVKEIITNCLNRGVILESYPWLNYIHIKPPAIISEEQVAKVLEALDYAMSKTLAS